MLWLPRADPASPPTEAALASAEILDYEQEFDAADGSWQLRTWLPQASAARVQLWCAGCGGPGRAGSGTLRLLAAQQPSSYTAKGDTQASLSSGSSSVAAIVVVLDGATPGHLAPGRRLAQAPAPEAGDGCSLTVAGTRHSFAACGAADLPRVGDYAIKVHATVMPDGAGSMLKLGIQANNQGSRWVG